MPSDAMKDFRTRVSPRTLPELMDGDCTYEEFRACLQSLEQVNRWFLGYRPTLHWLERLSPSPGETIHIVDAGSGGGDLLRQIARWSQKREVSVTLTGIDMNPHAIRASEESTAKGADITWVQGDILAFRPERPIDIVVSSLMTHHLEDDQIVSMLQWMETNARVGWFINDLERSERSSRFFRWIGTLAGWHRFVLHDGPVSFKRAFREEDWLRLLSSSNIPQGAVTLEHWRPGRLCVGRWK